MEHRCNDTYRENLETCSSTNLSTKSPMRAGLGLILSLHDERLASNYLSHDLTPQFAF